MGRPWSFGAWNLDLLWSLDIFWGSSGSERFGNKNGRGPLTESFCVAVS